MAESDLPGPIMRDAASGTYRQYWKKCGIVVQNNQHDPIDNIDQPTGMTA